MTELAFIPISVPDGWALPIIIGCVVIVVVLVGVSVLINRRRKR
jgi:hypothetical protein